MKKIKIDIYNLIVILVTISALIYSALIAINIYDIFWTDYIFNSLLFLFISILSVSVAVLTFMALKNKLSKLWIYVLPIVYLIVVFNPFVTLARNHLYDCIASGAIQAGTCSLFESVNSIESYQRMMGLVTITPFLILTIVVIFYVILFKKKLLTIQGKFKDE